MANLPTTKKIFDLVGESRSNPDGSSRQDELLQCEPGEPVQLLREPSNAQDQNAILVLSSRGIGIGYVRSEDAEVVAPAIDAHRPHLARLHRIRGGVPAMPSYGAQISISWDGRPDHPHVPLYQEQIATRRSKRAIKGRDRDDAGRLVGKSRGGCAVTMVLLAGAVGLLFGAAGQA